MYDMGYGQFWSIMNGTAGTVPLTLGSLGFAAAAIDAADAALVTIYTADVNYRFDGTAVGTGVGGGHAIASGGERVFRGNALVRNLQFISKTTTAATINVTLMAR